MNYKGFGKELKCRGFQYEIGKKYIHNGKISICNSGFHSCENPIDVLCYYPPSSRFATVNVSGIIKKEKNKTASSEIEIVSEISLAELIKKGVEETINSSHAATSGKYSPAATSGDSSPAATSGDYSPAATSGYSSTAATSGKNSIACSIGKNASAKSSVGNWLVLSEYDENGNVVVVKTKKVDGKRLKADTFYKLVGGKFVEADDD